jgi:hypothetical protein
MADAPASGSVASRLGMAVVGGALGGFAVWLTLRNLSLSTHAGFIFWVPITLWLLTMCVLCLWSAVSGDQAASRASIGASWRVGWLVGGVGLAIGFVGPLVIYPKSNLGPLLGILLTGPLGFVVGALGAGVVRAAQGSRTEESP